MSPICRHHNVNIGSVLEAHAYDNILNSRGRFAERKLPDQGSVASYTLLQLIVDKSSNDFNFLRVDALALGPWAGSWAHGPGPGLMRPGPGPMGPGPEPMGPGPGPKVINPLLWVDLGHTALRQPTLLLKSE